MKKRNLFRLILMTGSLVYTASLADEQENRHAVRVTDIAVCRSVENRQPVGADSVFGAQIGSLCCFTRIEGTREPTTVKHVWYHGEKKVSECSLPVKAFHWRTYSRRSILPSQTGRWNVVILSQEGDPLHQVSFTITPQ